MCIDMRKANEAIIRESHQMPTIDELIHDLNGSTLFSKLDPISWSWNLLVA